MRYGWLIGLLGLLTISSLFIGVSTIQVIDLLQFKGQSTQLFLATRLPRTVCLILAGATSSICGLIMQHLTQNKFVSPTTAGTMDSARLGILVVMLFLPNAPLLLRSFTAFLFAFHPSPDRKPPEDYRFGEIQKLCKHKCVSYKYMQRATAAKA